jgi:hypothetical protein
MKMRVRGYDEHRLKDPYKFWSKLLDTPPRRKRKGVAQYTYVSRIDESTLQFTMGHPSKDTEEHKLLCTLADNDTWTIHIKPDQLFPGEGNRLHALIGVWPAWNKKNFAVYENACRLYESWARNLPYEPGAQVYKGKILNPEKYVDRKRVIDESLAPAVRKKLQKVYELAPIMVRLLEAQGDRKKVNYYNVKALLRQTADEIDLDNINGLDAERVFLLGEACTTRSRTLVSGGIWGTGPHGASIWVRPEWEEEPISEYRHRCVVNGLRKLREHIYSKEGVYQYKPIKQAA